MNYTGWDKLKKNSGVIAECIKRARAKIARLEVSVCCCPLDERAYINQELKYLRGVVQGGINMLLTMQADLSS